jgi:hypothetical protein
VEARLVKLTKEYEGNIRGEIIANALHKSPLIKYFAEAYRRLASICGENRKQILIWPTLSNLRGCGENISKHGFSRAREV